MKIAILGSGRVGAALGVRWAKAGHEVLFCSREPNSPRVVELVETAGENATAASLQNAADLVDVVVIASPWNVCEHLLGSVGDLGGKVLIDCVNPINAEFTGLDLGFDTSAAEKIAQWAPQARVVKAFNTVSSATMADANFGEHPPTLFYCGDDDDAKKAVHQLAEDLDFDPIDAGELTMARYLEPLAMLYIKLAMQGMGNTAFKLLKR